MIISLLLELFKISAVLGGVVLAFLIAANLLELIIKTMVNIFIWVIVFFSDIFGE